MHSNSETNFPYYAGHLFICTLIELLPKDGEIVLRKTEGSYLDILHEVPAHLKLGCFQRSLRDQYVQLVVSESLVSRVTYTMRSPST